MRERLNWFVDFRGDFPKPDPLEPLRVLPGKEVATWLADGLKERRFTVHSFETYDIEHVICCSSGLRRFSVYVWVDDIQNMQRWEVCCPSNVSWLGRLFGRLDHDEHRMLLEAIDDILRGSSRVHDIRLFRDYESPWLRDKYPQYPGPVMRTGSSA